MNGPAPNAAYRDWVGHTDAGNLAVDPRQVTAMPTSDAHVGEHEAVVKLARSMYMRMIDAEVPTARRRAWQGATVIG